MFRKGIAVIVVVVAAAWFGGTAWLNSRARVEAERIAADLREEGVEARWQQIKVNPLSRTTTLTGLTLTGKDGQRFTAEKLLLSDLDLENDPPTHATAQLINFTAPKDDDRRAALQWLGYTTPPKKDFTLSWHWDEETAGLTVDQMTTEAKEIGSCSLTATFGNVDLEKLADRKTLLMHGLSITLSKATLTCSDDGVTARYLKAAATEKDVTIEQIKSEIIANVEENAADFGDSAEIREAVAALKTFINAPGQLTVTVEPEQPLPLLRIATAARNPTTLLRLLRVKVKA